VSRYTDSLLLGIEIVLNLAPFAAVHRRPRTVVLNTVRDRAVDQSCRRSFGSRFRPVGSYLLADL